MKTIPADSFRFTETDVEPLTVALLLPAVQKAVDDDDDKWIPILTVDHGPFGPGRADDADWQGDFLF